MRITAVEETNSLLIQATAAQYGSILDAIKKLDTEPLQVLIEAHVVQVTLNEALNYGVNYFLSNFDPNSDGVNIGGGGGEVAKRAAAAARAVQSVAMALR